MTPTIAPLAFVHAAGGIGADARPLDEAPLSSAPARLDDAKPVALRALAQSLGLRMPRLASRFAQLAVIGSRLALKTLSAPLPADTPLYLATGLGDIARTDALYYEVMPPSSQMASPAQFATSGNTMAAFFVAQQAALSAPNFTVSLDELSFEAALQLGCDELAARRPAVPHAVGASAAASEPDLPRVLVGAVDETTLPRDYFTRRFAPAEARPIGEGSGWLVLGRAAAGAIGELLQARVLPPSQVSLQQWARQIADELAPRIAPQIALPDVRPIAPEATAPGEPASATTGATLLFGCSVDAGARRALLAAMPACTGIDYTVATGCFPTAAALAIGAAFGTRDAGSYDGAASRVFVHLNRDVLGRTGIVAIRVYCNANAPVAVSAGGTPMHATSIAAPASVRETPAARARRSRS